MDSNQIIGNKPLRFTDLRHLPGTLLAQGLRRCSQYQGAKADSLSLSLGFGLSSRVTFGVPQFICHM